MANGVAVEINGCWGAESQDSLSLLATCLAIPMQNDKSQATAALLRQTQLHFGKVLWKTSAGLLLDITFS